MPRDYNKKLLYNRAYHEANKEDIKAKQIARRLANRDEILSKGRAKYAKNSKKIRAAANSYYASNKERMRARDKAYREAHRERWLANKKAYGKANPEKIKAWRLNAKTPENLAKRRAAWKARYNLKRDEFIARSKDFYQKNKDHKKAYDKVYYASRKNHIRSRVSKRSHSIEGADSLLKMLAIVDFLKKSAQ